MKPGKCPHCGGESNGEIGYSSPPTTWCSDCGEPWTFGPGVRQVSDEERKKMRPGFFEVDPISREVLDEIEHIAKHGYEPLPKKE